MGPDAGSAEAHRAVMLKVKEWDERKPGIFTPVFTGERDPGRAKFFPELCFLVDYCCKSLENRECRSINNLM
jgi:hypothetical protein